MSAERLSWYWHRFRAMAPEEWIAHAQKQCLQRIDARRGWRQPSIDLSEGRGFPHLPPRGSGPRSLEIALMGEAASLVLGRWQAFGQICLQVDDPPRWHRDYLAGRELSTQRIAFKLNHRTLPDGADIKLIWELSRWSALVRLAQVYWLTDDTGAGQTCIAWLKDWNHENGPWRGWNWTSALESGIRLVQLSWLDALLDRAEAPWQEEWARLRSALLPPHLYFTWRYRSSGSSANNHLLGELAGLLMAVARWPKLETWAAPLEKLQTQWETETLVQFAPDGGNREQALNYHLFAFEFCWQARAALLAANRTVAEAVEERLHKAADFFLAVQEPVEPWDYGDSDDAYVTPLFRSERTRVFEWAEWMRAHCGHALDYWLNPPPLVPRNQAKESWRHFPQSGQAVLRSNDWFLRWDVSPLGYLETAAHGHLDALHLSLWYRGMAWVIDPGTGAYYADAQLREYLAGRAAHNGPNPAGLELASRKGPFLWGKAHERPRWRERLGQVAEAELDVAGGTLRRRVEPYRGMKTQGWRVIDEFSKKDGSGGIFSVRWQFPPETTLQSTASNAYRLSRHGSTMLVVAEAGWAHQVAVTAPSQGNWAGTVSMGFRQRTFAPCLDLEAPDQPGAFSTLLLMRTEA